MNASPRPLNLRSQPLRKTGRPGAEGVRDDGLLGGIPGDRDEVGILRWGDDGMTVRTSGGVFANGSQSSPAGHWRRVDVDGELVAEVVDDLSVRQVRWVSESPLGTTEFTFAGGVASTYNYVDPFGSATSPQPGTRFAGHDYERGKSELVNAKGRLYDPRNASFLTPDPLLQTAGRPANPYQYAIWNPLTYVDPTGFQIDRGAGPPTPAPVSPPPPSGPPSDFGSNATAERAAPTAPRGGVAPSPRPSRQSASRSLSDRWDDFIDSIDTGPNGTLTRISDGISGFGDTISMGLTRAVRGQFNGGDPTNAESTEYTAGVVTGYVVQMGGAAVALLKGAVRGGVNLVSRAVGRTGARSGSQQASVRAAARARPCGCFTAGTVVAAAEGEIPIEDVEVGDLVWSTDEDTGALELRPVLNVIEHADEETVELTLIDEAGEHEMLRATLEHPFYEASLGWTAAGELARGHQVRTDADHWLTVASVEDAGTATVYNLEVAGFHTFHVGHRAAWVHNVCPTGAARGTARARAISLPGWNRLSVDLAHIAARHMTGGALTAGRSVFTGLSERGVTAAIRQAYAIATKVAVQGDRVLLSGTTRTGMTVEMWLNRATRVIETAYPVVR